MFHQGFPDLVGQDEGRLVLHPQVSGQLQGRNPLHRVGVEGNGGQIDLQGQLMEGEDRARGHREGVVAGLAPPLPAGALEVVPIHRAADRAGHFLPLSPAQDLECLEGFAVAHAHHLPNRQGAGLGGEEEVLFVHGHHHIRYVVILYDIYTSSVVKRNISRMINFVVSMVW